MVHKIYGVLNLIDWTVNIKAGKATLRVHFTGGATTARGRVPATYATSDPVKQAIIEKSDYFKSRHIFVVDSMEVPDDAAAKARKAREAARAEAARVEAARVEAARVEAARAEAARAEAARAEAARVAAPKSFDKNPKEEDESPKLPAGDPVGEQGEPGEPEAEPATEENGEVPEAITVSSLDDAKDYLNEHFGIAKSQLRSRNAIEERAKENGVVFFFQNA